MTVLGLLLGRPPGETGLEFRPIQIRVGI